MKKLNSIKEVNEHFKSVKTTKKTQLCFKTAFRNVEKMGKLRIVFPVLVPAPDVLIDEYLNDLDKLGYNKRQVFWEGIALYFNKFYVPAAVKLMPSQKEKAKTPPITFFVKYLAELTPEELIKQQPDIQICVQAAWETAKDDEVLVDFAYVNDDLSTDLNKFTDSLLK